MMKHLARNNPRHAMPALSALAILAMLSACAAVGPNYAPPASRTPAGWNTPLEDGLRATPAVDPDLARWWQSFDDPALSDLVQKAVVANLDLAQAKARVREARARRGLSQAERYPSVDASGAARRSRGSESTGGGRERSLYSAGFDAGWEIDVFGGVRRSIEATEGDLQAAEAGLDNVLVSLTAEIGRNYVDARTYQTRLDVAAANLAAQQETYDLIHSRYEAGLSDELAVQQARYNLESTRSQIPSLRSGLAAARNRLAVLTGAAPGAVDTMLADHRPVPLAPATVAVGIPADTLRRRPDIRQAERQLAAQTARIGVAEADLYPKFKLTGGIGLEALNTNDLADWPSRTWNIGPGVSWKVFDAGAVRRNIDIQNAVQARYLAAYEAAVLSALEEVENALLRYAQEQVRRDHLAAAVDAARQAEVLARQKYQAGLVDFSNVLDAQRSLLSYQDQLATSEGTVTANLMALYKALGGGWQPGTAEGK